ncbi:SLBB domain-containing protein [Candidatus Poribacteria bacterium]|nr:SLBB domain-containing protein [Candidatus Poribacteria bacterium]
MKRHTFAVIFLCCVGLMMAACGSQKRIAPPVKSVGAYGAIVLDGPPFDDMVPVQVAILGDVAAPGTYSYEGPKSLQEIIALAGGPMPDADLTRIKVIPLAGYHSNKIINLEQLSQETPPFMLNLKNGDTVFIPAKPKQGSAN